MVTLPQFDSQRRMESSSSKKNPDRESSSNGPFYFHDLLERQADVATSSSPAQEQAMMAAVATAQGQAQWMQAFWFSSVRRKHPSLIISIKEEACVCIQSCQDTLGLVQEQQEEFERYWNKQIETALKKIHVEDLGALNTTELKDSIPLEDSEGRGRKDLEALEKKLSVKVVFCDNNQHVLLVGQKQKLQKKCFVLRSILSHYHWRLSGKDVF